MELLIFFALSWLLPLLTIKKKKADNNVVLDQKSTTCIKGILCIFVMLHNLGIDYLQNNYIDANYTGLTWVTKRITEYTGGIAVGVFFFLSAYGLIKSYFKSGNKFLIKLVFNNMLRLWLTAVAINLLEYLIFFKGQFETKDTLLRILNLDFFNDFNRMNRHGWFIATLLMLYLCFAITFFVCSFLKTEKKNVIAAYIIFAIPIIFFIYTEIADKGGMYSREIAGFSIGIIYALYSEKINRIAKKYFNILFPLSIVIYFVFVVLEERTATIAAIIFFILLSQKFDYYNPATYFLGKISLGIYLFLHFSTLVLSPYYLNNVYYWIIINAGFIIVSSIILYFLTYYILKVVYFIINLISKSKNKVNESSLEQEKQNC